jgi:hypothetical protein
MSLKRIVGSIFTKKMETATVSPYFHYIPLLIIDNYEITTIISSFCDLLENLSPEARKVWDSCRTRKLDAGFESGKSPKDFQAEIRTDVLKLTADLGANIAMTIYPIND